VVQVVRVVRVAGRTLPRHRKNLQVLVPISPQMCEMRNEPIKSKTFDRICVLDLPYSSSPNDLGDESAVVHLFLYAE
jgi:hypothetical protein